MKPGISDSFSLQLKQQRADLLAQIRARRGGLRGRAEAAAEALSNVGDDGAVADTERDLAIALEEREAAALVAIDAALQRIADGSFGLCVQCGAAMETARLHANPTALCCVACQSAHEHLHPGA